jgi:hypothetical protein
VMSPGYEWLTGWASSWGPWMLHMSWQVALVRGQSGGAGFPRFWGSIQRPGTQCIRSRNFGCSGPGPSRIVGSPSLR